MYELTVETHFSAAHCLRNHPGRCANLHGHNYRVAITIMTERLNEQGMAIDFADLKEICHQAIDPLDHTYLNDLPAFAAINPTAEEIARHIFNNIAERLALRGGARVRVARVSVYESEQSYATYRE